MFRPWREFGAVDRTGGKIAVARSSGPAPEPLGRNARFANGVSVAGRLRGHPMQDTVMRPSWLLRVDRSMGMLQCTTWAAVRSGAHALQPHVECECDETGQQMPQQRGKSPQVTRRGIRASTPLSQRRAGIASAHPRATFERSSRFAEGGEGPPSRKSTCFCICLIRSCDSSSAG